LLLNARRFAQNGLGPGAVEDVRQAAAIVGDGVERGVGVHGLFSWPARLAAQGDVACDAVKEGAEAAVSRGVQVVEGAARSEALHEHVLHRVVEILEERRAAPAGGEVGPQDGDVATGEFLALARGAAGRRPDKGPAGRLRVGGPVAARPAGHSPINLSFPVAVLNKPCRICRI